MNRPRQAGGAPAPSGLSGRAQAIGPGDPLVRALAVCIRQAHARRIGRRALDSRA